MNFRFVGGPYDGLELDESEVYRLGAWHKVRGEFVRKTFLLMPPREDWEPLLRGESARNEAIVPYEFNYSESGLFYRSPSAAEYQDAIRLASIEVSSLARTNLMELPKEQSQRVLDAVAVLLKKPPHEWFSGNVESLHDDDLTYLMRVPPDLCVFLNQSPFTGGAEIRDVMREGTLKFLSQQQLPVEVPT
jgi:hypothetical protein